MYTIHAHVCQHPIRRTHYPPRSTIDYNTPYCPWCQGPCEGNVNARNEERRREGRDYDDLLSSSYDRGRREMRDFLDRSRNGFFAEEPTRQRGRDDYGRRSPNRRAVLEERRPIFEERRPIVEERRPIIEERRPDPRLNNQVRPSLRRQAYREEVYQEPQERSRERPRDENSRRGTVEDSLSSMLGRVGLREDADALRRRDLRHNEPGRSRSHRDESGLYADRSGRGYYRFDDASRRDTERDRMELARRGLEADREERRRQRDLDRFYSRFGAFLW